MKLKRFFAVSLMLCLCLSVIAYASGPDVLYEEVSEATAVSAEMPTLSAKAAILMCEDGQILYGKNAHTRISPASTTKLMTVLTVLSSGCDLDETVKIPREAVGIEGSSVYLYEGEEMTLSSLLYAMMLESANDAATAVAIHVSGSVDAFADEMNKTAGALGLSDTHFTNPHGLDDENHYTTAYALAVIMQKALTYPAFCEMIGTYKTEIPLRNGQGVRLLVNHNRLLKTLDGCIGGKTGYTKKSGRCLVSAVKRDGMTLIAVTTNAPDDWNDHEKMYTYGFSAFERVTLSAVGEQYTVIPTVGAMKKASGDDDITTVAVRNETALSVLLPRGHGEITKTLHLPRFVYAPVCAGDILGEAVYMCEGEVLGRLPLYASESVAAYKKQSVFTRFFAWLSEIL